MTNLTRIVAIPIDGSENSLKALDYLNVIYDAKHDVVIVLLHVLPALPPILVADPNRQTRLRLLAVEEKSIRMAKEILREARSRLIKKGFRADAIQTFYQKKKVGIARDICSFAVDRRADALLITAKGRSRLETFFAGEISNKLQYCRVCPLWRIDGSVKSKRVLIAIDSSENALRAVDHAAFMLSGTDCQVTLFHTTRPARRFIPQEVLEEAPELSELWRNKVGQQIVPYMRRAKELLIQAWLSERQMRTKVIDGSRGAANDILKEARSTGCGTIVLGRKGHSGVKEFLMGSITYKVLQDSAGMAIWVV